MKPGEQTFLHLLREGSRRLGLEIQDDGLERLQIHFRLLNKWAERVNLTTVREPGGMAELLYLDSAILLKSLGPGSRLHDVGSGAGFPGLVIKALRPDLQVTLTEARRKKVSFLRQAAREMSLLDGLDIRHQRLGWEPGGGRERWPEVISRAAFPPAEWIRQGAPLVALGGRLWVCSGQPHGDDRDDLDHVTRDLEAGLPGGFKPEPALAYRLPFSGRRRLLVPLRRTSE